MLQKTDVDMLDDLLTELAQPAESQCELLREHLESARNYLLGSMPEEYQLSLRLANENLNCINNPDLRHRATDILAELMAEVH